MRRRIVALAVISAIVATSLFGIPLAAAVALHFVSQEATEVEHTADIAALDVAADMAHPRPSGIELNQPAGADVALYGSDGRLITGHGPLIADRPVRDALTGNVIRHQSGLDTMVAAVPIADLAGSTYAVRTSTATSEVYPKIGAAWFGMLVLGAAIVLLTRRLARWQAGRLAEPVEELARSATRLAGGDFTVTATSSAIPEIDTAATALNHASRRIGDLVERERSVTDHVSHQLRTPLAGLRLSLENALYTPGADFAAAARQAVDAADRLERTIDDLLLLARRRNPGVAKPPDLAELFHEIEALWRAPLAKQGRGLRLAIDTGLDPPACSSAAIRQILAVLTDNAARHGDGTITIRARETIGTVAIDVSDDGAGPGEDDDVLFDRGHAGPHGIGLGLARTLAEGEGGRLLLTGRAPTTFTFFMPEDSPDARVHRFTTSVDH